MPGGLEEQIPPTRRGAFLDRDGVINRDSGYVGTLERFEFLPGVPDACRALKELGYQLVIVTNQGGLALEHYSEDDYHRLTAHMLAELERAGAPVTAVYHCPWHPKGGDRYEQWRHWRKPSPAMLLQAAQEHDIDLAGSLMVGDRPTDMQAAEAAGVPLRFFVGSADQAPAGCRTCDSLPAVLPLLASSL